MIQTLFLDIGKDLTQSIIKPVRNSTKVSSTSTPDIQSETSQLILPSQRARYLSGGSVLGASRLTAVQDTLEEDNSQASTSNLNQDSNNTSVAAKELNSNNNSRNLYNPNHYNNVQMRDTYNNSYNRGSHSSSTENRQSLIILKEENKSKSKNSLSSSSNFNTSDKHLESILSEVPNRIIQNELEQERCRSEETDRLLDHPNASPPNYNTNSETK